MAKMSEKECLEIGGHCWNFKPLYITYGTDGVGYETPTMETRTCKHCRKKQVKMWTDEK